MDPHEPIQTSPRRTGTVARWLTLLTIISVLSIFVSPLGGSLKNQAQAAPIGAVTVSLSPGSQTKTVGDTATVTATVERTNTGLAVPFASVTFTVDGPNATSSTRIADFQGEASFSYTGDNSGEDSITATVGGYDSNVVTVDWNSAGPTLDLAPSSQTVTIGTTASITATLARPSGSINNIPVRFSVTGANSDGGTVYTNSVGVAAISYAGDTVGTDTVTAFADLNSNSVQDSGEPSATVTVTWIGYTITLSPSTQTSAVGSQVEIDATVLNGSDGVSGARVRYSVAGSIRPVAALSPIPTATPRSTIPVRIRVPTPSLPMPISTWTTSKTMANHPIQ